VDPVPDPLLFFLVEPGIEPGPPDPYPRTLTTRPQRLSLFSFTFSIMNVALINKIPFGNLAYKVPTVKWTMQLWLVINF
jgi:hypothetical protein